MQNISKFLIYFILAGLTLLFLVSINNILPPFIIGLIIAYFLNPAVSRIENKGVSRPLSTLAILSIFLFFITIFLYFIGPILYKQLVSLIRHIPFYIKTVNEFSTPYVNSFTSKFGYDINFDNNSLIKEISEYSLIFSKNLLSNLLHSSLAIINLFSLIVITPIVTFYLLKDWEIILKTLTNLVPKKRQKEFKRQFSEIDHTLSAYIRGQTHVCLLLGLFYAIGLSVIGLNYGFLIGFLTGIFAFIPYFGVFIGMSVGLTIAFLQFKVYIYIFLVLLVFLVGQFIEGNFITPKLVGSKVGIPPALIIFSLLVGGTLFGFIGILFAIPAIAVIGVLTRLNIKKYTNSKFYKS